MAYSLSPPELNRLQLAVLLDEFLAGEEELQATIMIAQANINLIEMALQEQERHQEPTRVEGYVEQVVPFYTTERSTSQAWAAQKVPDWQPGQPNPRFLGVRATQGVPEPSKKLIPGIDDLDQEDTVIFSFI
ncbi:hypothetical protein E2C01_053298 [Portunus trituberculatus]|uniref:Uncharacterized protein n=1 Tax=Portunus trituberculatus TaxID=210409 RepID=A0A5B7GJX8_PORTR|nr:hypothetical protein [Portunus trituberculatus]